MISTNLILDVLRVPMKKNIIFVDGNLTRCYTLHRKNL